MSICWYCHWGWPKPVADIYHQAKAALDGDPYPLHFGPAHVVWEDENFDLAASCLETFDQYRGDYSDAELAVVRASLEQLAALPESAWNVEPDDYDGAHPENYPPAEGVEMVSVSMWGDA